MLYYSCNKEPQNPILIIKAPTVPQQQISPSCKDWVRNLDPASVFGVPREPKKHLSSARLSEHWRKDVCRLLAPSFLPSGLDSDPSYLLHGS